MRFYVLSRSTMRNLHPSEKPSAKGGKGPSTPSDPEFPLALFQAFGVAVPGQTIPAIHKQRRKSQIKG